MKQGTILFIFLLFMFFPLHAQESTHIRETYSPKGSLSLRTNALTWLMLTPNLGIEYKTADHIGLLVEGGWSRWKLDTSNKYWRMWKVAPQVRYYLGDIKYSYIGAQYTMGDYNFDGRQGKYLGGGITLGHQFYCSKNLMVDLGLSLGYLYLYEKEKYYHQGGDDYRLSYKTSNGYWGPTGLSISFVWKIN